MTVASGAPAPGVLVEAVGPSESAMSGGSWPTRFWETAQTVTDPDGRYVLDGLVPGVRYRCKASRGSERVAGEAIAPAGGTQASLDLVLPDARSVEVRVTDADTGAGVVGLGLHAKPVGPYDVSWSGVTGEDGRLRVGPLRSAKTEVSPDGRWTVVEGEEIPASWSESGGAWRLRVRRQPPADEGKRNAVPAEESPSAEEEARSPLRLRVTDSSGQVVALADVRWTSKARENATSGDVATEDGVALIPRGGDDDAVTWVVVGRARGRDGQSLPLGRVRAGPFLADAVVAEVCLPPERVVAGRVLDPTGAGLVGLRVRVVETVDGAGAGPSELETAARTDAQGRFRIGGLGSGKCLLLTTVPYRYADVWPLEVTPDGDPVEVRLRDSVEATVKVSDAYRPVVTAQLRAWTRRAHGRDPSATTSPDGRATLVGLDPEDAYRLEVQIARDGSSEQRVLQDWSPHDTEVRFGLQRTVRGTVRDPAGRPIPGAYVSGWNGKRRVAEAVTGADGAFELADEGEGLRQVFAAMVSWGQGPWTGFVDAPQGDTTLTLVLDPGGTLAVRLEGRLVAGRAVFVSSDLDAGWDASEYQCATSDEEGVARFRGLRAGRPYVVWTGPRRVESAWNYDELTGFAADVRAGPPDAEVRVRLAPGGEIRVRLRGAGERPRLRANHGLMEVKGVLQPDGTVLLQGLCDVEWTVLVEDGSRRAEAKARPGADLVLEPTAETPGQTK